MNEDRHTDIATLEDRETVRGQSGQNAYTLVESTLHTSAPHHARCLVWGKGKGERGVTWGGGGGG